MDPGSSLTRVELDPDQMNGEAHSGETGLRNPVPDTSEPSLRSLFSGDISCQPTSLPEGTEEVEVFIGLRFEAESWVSIRTDAVESDELWRVIFSLISMNGVEKLWCTVRGPSITHHIGLVLAMLQRNEKMKIKK